MSAISWFEIPTQDIERAERFYGELLQRPLRRESFDGKPMSIFAHDKSSGTGGALVQDPGRKPANQGALVYLSTADLDGAIARTPAAGGSVVQPRTAIGPEGFIALVRDTEGNLVGLHSEA